ncbi:transcriptional regulator [Robertmurraya sp. DFI.2.37]|uniref:transcriptional regulator n=1 Tax=Robertmurraya sp. DFI.2.37 TaxID=3031819 RepID=UPI001244DB77|nr:transcriptional regulator [Robertmurraya sp. DFI.2.37]MDF1507634.1 transcriptional regulator [Robertmurraya sp. DFI.2.37]
MTTAVKLKKATFKHIESELYSYHDTLREIEELRKNIMFTRENDDENIGGGRSSFVSSPTERTATRLVTHKKLNRLEEVANAIQKVYTGLPEDYQKLVRLKYWTRPQLKTWEGIAKEIPVSRRTAFNMRDEIINLIGEVLGWR